MPSTNQHYLWVSSDDELQNLCTRLPRNAIVAIDCEFIRRTTFRPIPALIQIGWESDTHGTCCSLVDPIDIEAWQPLIDVFHNRDQDQPVVMHAAREDIQVLRQLGIENFPLFDSQIAAALTLGIDNLGYGTLIEKILGHSLHQSSSIQKSNWLKRPLTASQCEYARQDVAWLPQLYSQLHAALQATQRSHWHRQECNALFLTSDRRPQNEAWMYVKGANKLRQPLFRARLQILAQWRENQADRLNRPRNMLLDDAQLIQVCLKPNALEHSLRLSRFAKEFDSQSIIQVRDQIATASPDAAPHSSTLSTAQSALFKEVKQALGQEAERLNIPPFLLANKRKISDWVLGKKVDFGQWQTPYVSEVLQQYRNQITSSRVS